MKTTVVILIVHCLYTFQLFAQWIHDDGPTSKSVITCFTISDGNLFASAYGGIYEKSFQNLLWEQVFINYDVYSLASLNNKLFAGTNRGLFFKNNESWKEVFVPSRFSSIPFLAAWENKLIARTFGNYFGYKNYIFISSDGGSNWNEIISLQNKFLLSYAVLDSCIFLGTSSGIFRSGDGVNWVEVSNGLTDSWITSLASYGTNIFAGSSSGKLFLSKNSGQEWKCIKSFNSTGYNKISSLLVFGNNIYAGVWEEGVYISRNAGEDWEQINDGLNTELSKKVGPLMIYDSILFGGAGLGVWYRSLSDIFTHVDFDKKILSNYSLSQNYPNPFNPITNIKFTIETQLTVSLRIYDILGNEIATLINEEKPAGEYEIRFDASDLSSGVYYYKILANDVKTGTGFTQTKKMLLMR